MEDDLSVCLGELLRCIQEYLRRALDVSLICAASPEDPIPTAYKLCPPSQVCPETLIQPEWHPARGWAVDCMKQVNHAPEEWALCPHNLAGMVQESNEGL